MVIYGLQHGQRSERTDFIGITSHDIAIYHLIVKQSALVIITDKTAGITVFMGTVVSMP